MRRLLLTVAIATAAILAGCSQLVVVGTHLAKADEAAPVYQLTRSQIMAELEERLFVSTAESEECQAELSSSDHLHAVNHSTPQQSEQDQPAQCLSKMEA
jgi:hypothetical protein